MKFIFLFLLSLCSLSQAAPRSGTPLFFQADKNNLQVLPQRFEYALIDEDRIKIGDILIDSTKLNFKIYRAENNKYKLRFSWPAGLLLEGNLLIKNNVGKAIFSAAIEKNRIHITKSDQSSSADNIRADRAEYIATVDASLLEDMKYLPFMNFCVFREDEGTRIYLCSKELYLSPKEGDLTIRSRNSTQKAAQVEINTQVVGNQGIIFLNDAKENLVLKAFSKNGALLEIETRRKDVDFKDVVLNEDGSKLILTASGAEPVNESAVQKISADEWKIEVPVKRPVVYLKGEGDIPMRQEFFIKGDLPTEQDRAYLIGRANTRTYSSALEFDGVLPEDTSASVNDSDSRLMVTSKGYFRWVTGRIPSNIKTRRYLLLKHGDHQWTAGHDLFRGNPFELGAAGVYSTPSGLMAMNLHFSWWAENFLFIPSNITYLHWGLNAELQQHLTTKSSEPKVDLTTLELLYRFNQGFYLNDETWGLSLPLQMVKTDAGSPTLLGLGAFLHKKAPANWSKYMSWYQGKLRYFFSSTGSDFKVKQAYEMDAIAYRPLSASLFFNYGAGLSQYKYDPKAGKESMQLNLSAGVSYNF